jgi:hypothetical protein
MKYIYIILFFLLTTGVFGQQNFYVQNIDTKELVSFPRADLNGKPLVRGDIDGKIALPKGATGTLRISAFEYFDTTFVLGEYEDSTVYLKSNVRVIDEAIIIPGENPAHRIINLVIDNKRKNDPLKNDAFSYNAYNKFTLQSNPDDIKAIADTAKDAKLLAEIAKAQNQHYFLTETTSERGFVPPFRDKEVITSYKVSGFQDPLLSLLASQMQSFSFYDNQFTIMEKAYLNPIAAGGTRRYLFIIEDTTFHGKDTTYGISFRPRKSTSFEGMKGMLYINSRDYAIEKVIASPKDTTGMFGKIKITQEYRITNDLKWFPYKLISELDVPVTLNTKARPVAKSISEIKNVQFNPVGLKVKNDNYSVDLAENAGETTQEEWLKRRGTVLTQQEENTYKVMDSIGKTRNFDRRLTFLKALSTGKLPILKNNVTIDLANIARYNQYEHQRIGLGLETGSALMKRVAVGGYFAYGVSDKVMKYGGHASFTLSPRTQGKLKLTYRQDILERGLTNFSSTGYEFGASGFYRKLYAKYFDTEQSARASYSFFPRANIYINTLAEFQRINTTEGYAYFGRPAVESGVVATDMYQNPFDNFNVGLEIKWNVREKAMRLADQRYALPTLWPMIRVQVTKALPAIFGSELNFWRFAADIEETVNIRAVGRLRMLATAGATLGYAPLMYQHTALGTGGKWALSVPNTFESARPGEFYNDQQACFFTRLTFKQIKTGLSIFKPHISLHHALGFGGMNDVARHTGLNFKTMEKGLFEGGIIIDDLFSTSIFGLGVGVIQRYGAYADPNALKNFTYKIALRLALN